MKLIKGILLLLVVTTFSVSFTACSDDDDYVVRAELYYSTDPASGPLRSIVTNSEGVFRTSIPLNVNDIVGYDRYRMGYIDHIDFLDSEFYIYTNSVFANGDYISFDLFTNQTRRYPFDIRIVDGSTREIRIDARSDSKYDEFMRRLVDELIMNGSATLYIEGGIVNRNGTPLGGFVFNVESSTYLDIYVRD